MRKITTEEAKTLCKFYDRSDRDALEYLVYFCKNEDMKQLFKLAQNAQILDMYDIYSTMTAEDYQQQKWELFNKYGFYMKQEGGMYFKENEKEKEEETIIETWEEFEQKYKNEMRDFMTEEREREFVNDYCNCCEAEGFNNVYWSPYTEWENYYGKPFKVIKRATERENDLEVLPMWIIQFEDGKRIQAYPEEIVTSEMERNECPKKYLTKKENNKMIKTWEEFEKEYGDEERETMSTERERQMVNDLANCYENDGLNKVFWSPFDNDGEIQYYGKPFKVLGRCPENRNNLRILPLWDIEFEDGKQLTVEHCEIFTKSMADIGCPKEFLIEKDQEDLNCLYARLMMKLQCELFSYKEILYRMTVDEVMDEAYKLTMLKEFVKIFETQSKETLNVEQFNFFLRMDNALEYLYATWLGYDSNEREIFADFLFEGWNWEM